MVALEANWLDEETILRKLPNISPDEVEQILLRKAQEGASIYTKDEGEGNDGGETPEEEEEEDV